MSYNMNYVRHYQQQFLFMVEDCELRFSFHLTRVLIPINSPNSSGSTIHTFPHLSCLAAPALRCQMQPCN